MTYYYPKSQTGGKSILGFEKGVRAFRKKERRALRLKRRRSAFLAIL